MSPQCTYQSLNSYHFVVKYTSVKLKFKNHISMKVGVIIVITLKLFYCTFCKTNCHQASEYHYWYSESYLS